MLGSWPQGKRTGPLCSPRRRCCCSRQSPSFRAQDRPPLPSLVVTPLTHIASSGPLGGPFLPSSFQYRLNASTGTVNYSIRHPSWLTVSSSFGVTDESGVTITLTVNSTASRLVPGKYGPSVAFRTSPTVRAVCPGPRHLHPGAVVSAALRRHGRLSLRLRPVSSWMAAEDI